MQKINSFQVGKAFTLPVRQSHGIAFAIPATRLVRVEYRKDGVKYACNIIRPQGQESLRCAMLARHVGISQVISVAPVVEWARPQCRD